MKTSRPPQRRLDVLFSPAEFAQLPAQDLSRTTFVVFDILRATTSMTVALDHGALAIIPVAEIAQAVAVAKSDLSFLLAGERNGLRILAAESGGRDFDFGNSPREFPTEKVKGKTLVMTTTNGTRALQACAGARHIYPASFLNLSAVAYRLLAQTDDKVVIVCAGTFEEAAYEDTLAAGALCDSIWASFGADEISDSAQIARRLFLADEKDLKSAIRRSRNARRLLASPELAADVDFSLQRDTISRVAVLHGQKVSWEDRGQPRRSPPAASPKLPS